MHADRSTTEEMPDSDFLKNNARFCLFNQLYNPFMGERIGQKEWIATYQENFL